MAKHTMHELQKCPSCGYGIDCVIELYDDDIEVQDGDFSICFNCFSVLRYGKGLKISLSSIEEAENEEVGLGKYLDETITRIRPIVTDLKKDVER